MLIKTKLKNKNSLILVTKKKLLFPKGMDYNNIRKRKTEDKTVLYNNANA